MAETEGVLTFSVRLARLSARVTDRDAIATALLQTWGPWPVARIAGIAAASCLLLHLLFPINSRAWLQIAALGLDAKVGALLYVLLFQFPYDILAGSVAMALVVRRRSRGEAVDGLAVLSSATLFGVFYQVAWNAVAFAGAAAHSGVREAALQLVTRTIPGYYAIHEGTVSLAMGALGESLFQAHCFAHVAGWTLIFTFIALHVRRWMARIACMVACYVVAFAVNGGLWLLNRNHAAEIHTLVAGIEPLQVILFLLSGSFLLAGVVVWVGRGDV